MSRVCIIGCGAVGCLLAGFIGGGGGTPICVARRETHRERLASEGCLLEGLIQRRVRVEARLPGELGEASCDYAVVASKAYDAPQAAEEALRVSRIVAAAYNGFPQLPLERSSAEWIGVIVEYGALRIGDNVVNVTGLGRLIIGPEGGGSLDAAERLGEVLERGGAKVLVVGDITPYRWAKAAVNAGLNPVTAILGVSNGYIANNEWARSLAVEAAGEVAMVAEALGVKLPYDPAQYLVEIAEKTRGNKSSMLQDVERGRRTEVEEILGYVARKAAEAGVEVPTLSHLYMLVKALEAAGGRVCRIGKR